MWVQQLYQNKQSRPEINLAGLILAQRTVGQGGSFFRIGSKYIIFEIAKWGNSVLGDSIRMCSMRFWGWQPVAGGAIERGNTCPLASSTQTNVSPPSRNPLKSLLPGPQMQPWWLCTLTYTAGQNSLSAAQSRTMESLMGYGRKNGWKNIFLCFFCSQNICSLAKLLRST